MTSAPPDTPPRENGAWFPASQWLNAQGDGLSLDLPLQDVHGYWHPLLNRPVMKLDWRIELATSPAAGFPVLSFFTTDHRNRLTLGLSNLTCDALLTARMDQTGHRYRLSLEVPPEAQADLQIWIDRSDRPWTDAVADYRQQVRDRHTGSECPTYPAAAWQPVYCSWYARHRRLDTAWVEGAAQAAAALGFGTFILDDGWSFEDSSTVGTDLSTWYAPVGPWQPWPGKFPDYAEHVKRVQALGLNYLLWVAPLMLGTDSEIGRRWYRDQPVQEGYFDADPNSDEQIQTILANIEALLTAAPIDGLKIDFLDNIQPSVKRPTGPAMLRFMEALTTLVHRHCRAGLIEYRQRYVGPALHGLATQFRAGDVPYDFVDNLQRLAAIRLCVGDGVPAHADPAYWHPQETEVNIHRHMIAALAGVPMVSMELAELPENARRIIAHWLAVYQQHLPIFQQGRWQIHYHFDLVAAMSVRSGEKAVVLIYDAALWPAFATQIDLRGATLINGSSQPIMLPHPCRCLASDGTDRTTAQLAPGERCEAVQVDLPGT